MNLSEGTVAKITASHGHQVEKDRRRCKKTKKNWIHPRRRTLELISAQKRKNRKNDRKKISCVKIFPLILPKKHCLITQN